jgi:hypothetical protein
MKSAQRERPRLVRVEIGITAEVLIGAAGAELERLKACDRGAQDGAKQVLAT